MFQIQKWVQTFYLPGYPNRSVTVPDVLVYYAKKTLTLFQTLSMKLLSQMMHLITLILLCM
jgi:hypothetical protein